MSQPTEVTALLKVADSHLGHVKRAVYRRFKEAQAQLSPERVAALIAEGFIFEIPARIDWQGLFKMPSLSTQLYGVQKGVVDAAAEEVEALADDLTRTFLATMVDVATKASVLDVERFTLTNPYAIRAAQQQAGRLVVQISSSTRAVINRTIVQAMNGELTPQSAASVISRTIGLDARRAAAVTRYANNLDPMLSDERFQAAIDRYANRMLMDRAETIARTEIMEAANSGLEEQWREAMRTGLIDKATATKLWVVTDDDRLCDECLSMDGQEVPVVNMFLYSGLDANTDVSDIEDDSAAPGSEIEVNPPLHPRCRCTMVLVNY